jgi:uncharacterized protein YutE (UPF0331/DUF86 family)
MTTHEALTTKVREVLHNITLVKKYQKYSREEIEKDLTLQGAIQHYLYIVCQSAIDLGEMYIEHESYRVPSTYADVFDILLEQEVIDPDIALTMRNMAGFRNILAHQYGKVEFDIVHTVLMHNIDSIEQFVHIIEKTT